MDVQETIHSEITYPGRRRMAVHHGGKVGKAGKTLAESSSSKGAKSKAGKTLASHKAAKH